MLSKCYLLNLPLWQIIIIIIISQLMNFLREYLQMIFD